VVVILNACSRSLFVKNVLRDVTKHLSIYTVSDSITCMNYCNMRASFLLLFAILATFLRQWKVEAFGVSIQLRTRSRSRLAKVCSAARHSVSHDDDDGSSTRRGFLLTLPGLALPLVVNQQPSLANDDSPNKPPKILVLGKGFLGSQVCSTLADLGIETIATTRDGRDGTVALDFLQDDVSQKVERLAIGCSAVISCVGAIGTKHDKAVNAGTGLAAQGAKRAGVERFVYITVAPEVKEFARDVEFLQEYMSGKTSSREVVLEEFNGKAVLIEPTFVYGGGSFELNPPRVASFYGQFIEGILSSNPIRNVERVLSPGFVKIALEPPVPVEDVAKAAVAGALGETQAILDSYDKIKQASSQLA
jgi:putative NADH-flavin reductase